MVKKNKFKEAERIRELILDPEKRKVGEDQYLGTYAVSIASERFLHRAGLLATAQLTHKIEEMTEANELTPAQLIGLIEKIAEIRLLLNWERKTNKKDKQEIPPFPPISSRVGKEVSKALNTTDKRVGDRKKRNKNLIHSTKVERNFAPPDDLPTQIT